MAKAYIISLANSLIFPKTEERSVEKTEFHKFLGLMLLLFGDSRLEIAIILEHFILLKTCKSI